MKPTLFYIHNIKIAMLKTKQRAIKQMLILYTFMNSKLSVDMKAFFFARNAYTLICSKFVLCIPKLFKVCSQSKIGNQKIKPCTTNKEPTYLISGTKDYHEWISKHFIATLCQQQGLLQHSIRPVPYSCPGSSPWQSRKFKSDGIMLKCFGKLTEAFIIQKMPTVLLAEESTCIITSKSWISKLLELVYYIKYN